MLVGAEAHSAGSRYFKVGLIGRLEIVGWQVATAANDVGRRRPSSFDAQYQQDSREQAAAKPVSGTRHAAVDFDSGYAHGYPRREHTVQIRAARSRTLAAGRKNDAMPG
jgi:hypothetical protein